MRRDRKGPSRTPRVKTTVTLYGNPVVAVEPVSPVVTVTANAQALAAKRTADIRFRVGIVARKQYG